MAFKKKAKKHSVMNKEVEVPEPAAPSSNPMAPMKMEPDENEMERMGHHDMETLMAAEDIKSNPDKMKYVSKAHAQKTQQLNKVKSIKDLHDTYEMKFGNRKK